jgi:hypothetical protein
MQFQKVEYMAVPQFEIQNGSEWGASLECGGLTPLCSATESLFRSGALRALLKRRQAAALQGGAQFQTEPLPNVHAKIAKTRKGKAKFLFASLRETTACEKCAFSSIFAAWQTASLKSLPSLLQ